MDRTAISSPVKRMAALAAALSLSACVGGPDNGRSSAPVASRPSNPGPVPSPPRDVASRSCFAQLDAAGVRYTPLPDQDFGSGCHARASVRVTDLGTPTSNLGPMTCSLASNFAAWVRHAVRPAARQVYGEDLARVETFGTYSCRNIYGGRSGRLSQHAFANAVDVSAFVLEDGRRIVVLGGWNGSERDQRFLRLIRASACRRFGTVLSPDYNAAHANHFHFDMSGQNFCR